MDEIKKYVLDKRTIHQISIEKDHPRWDDIDLDISNLQAQLDALKLIVDSGGNVGDLVTRINNINNSLEEFKNKINVDISDMRIDIDNLNVTMSNVDAIIREFANNVNIIHISDVAPTETNKLWVDSADEDADDILQSDLAIDLRNTVSAMKEKVDSLEYALEYELDPGYFNGVLPGSSPGDDTSVPGAPNLSNGASGTVGHILVKRGLKEDIEALQEGEFGWCVDTEELYIGNRGRLKMLAKAGGGAGGGGGDMGNVTADYIELIAANGSRYRLTINDAGEPIILNSESETITLPKPDESGRFKGLFINKVYGGGAKQTNSTPVSHSFIELYNTTDSPIKLRGLSIQYGEYLKPWQVLPLRGEVKPYSSFLIRCAEHSSPYRKSTRVKINDFDMGWESVAISDNGCKVYLCVGTDPVSFTNPANTDGQWSKATGYINMFSYGGEDVTRTVDGYEKTYLHISNKYRMMKRKYSEELISAFANTGDNGKDIEFLDMRTADIETFSPRSSKFGQWDYSYDQAKLDENAPSVINICFGYDGDTTRTFTWQSPPTKYSYVKYKAKGSLDWMTVSTDKKLVSHQDAETMVHSAIVRNLIPGTTYIYKAGFEGNWSDEYELEVRDARAQTTPTKILWVTDQQAWSSEETSAWGKANDYIEKNEDYDFIINTGDIAQNANRFFEWKEYYDVAKNNMSTNVQMTVIGNNDLVDKLYSTSFTYYSTVENSPYPSVYSWNYGYTHYIGLDTNILKDPLDSSKWLRGTDEQIEFIRSDMAKPENKKRWVVVLMHESCYTIIRSPKALPFLNVLYDMGVDLVLCGHHHCYTRSHRMGKLGAGNVDVIDNNNGVYYLMLQATGFKLSGKTLPTENAIWRAVYEKPGDPCYATIEITWDKIIYKAYRLTNIIPLIDNVGKAVVPIEFDSLTILPKLNRGQ